MELEICLWLSVNQFLRFAFIQCDHQEPVALQNTCTSNTQLELDLVEEWLKISDWTHGPCPTNGLPPRFSIILGPAPVYSPGNAVRVSDHCDII